jgi:UDP-glucose 4-epimerase
MIFLTGATGFLGSHIAEYLSQRNSGLLLLVRSASDKWRIKTLTNVEYVEGDLSDPKRMRDIFQRYRPDAVVHAAWHGTNQSRDSVDQFENFVNTKDLFELCGEFGCRKVIGIGSQNEYGIHNVRLTEATSAAPSQPYGLYKLSAGLLGQCYARKYGFDYAWLRLFSTFGPKDYPGYFIPLTISSFLKGQPPELTQCNQTWDYLYVKDIPALIERVLALEHKFCGIYNLCSGEPVVLKDVVMMIREILSTDIVPRFGALPNRTDGLHYLLGDNAKFRTEFGWIRPVPLREALQQTIQWYCSNSLKTVP